MRSEKKSKQSTPRAYGASEMLSLKQFSQKQDSANDYKSYLRVINKDISDHLQTTGPNKYNHPYVKRLTVKAVSEQKHTVL